MLQPLGRDMLADHIAAAMSFATFACVKTTSRISGLHNQAICNIGCVSAIVPLSS